MLIIYWSHYCILTH